MSIPTQQLNMNWFLPLVELIKIRKEKFMLNEKTIQAIGLFKFSLIAPLINDTFKSFLKLKYKGVSSIKLKIRCVMLTTNRKKNLQKI